MKLMNQAQVLACGDDMLTQGTVVSVQFRQFIDVRQLGLEYRPFHDSNSSHYGINRLYRGELCKIKRTKLANTLLDQLNSLADIFSPRKLTRFNSFGHTSKGLVQHHQHMVRVSQHELQRSTDDAVFSYFSTTFRSAIFSGDVCGREDCANRPEGLNPNRTRLARLNGEHKYPRSRKDDYYARDRRVSLDELPHLIAQHLAFLLKPTSQRQHLACGGAA